MTLIIFDASTLRLVHPQSENCSFNGAEAHVRPPAEWLWCFLQRRGSVAQSGLTEKERAPLQRVHKQGVSLKWCM